jgi:hypothetical protein
MHARNREDPCPALPCTCSSQALIPELCPRRVGRIDNPAAPNSGFGGRLSNRIFRSMEPDDITASHIGPRVRCLVFGVSGCGLSAQVQWARSFFGLRVSVCFQTAPSALLPTALFPATRACQSGDYPTRALKIAFFFVSRWDPPNG